MTIGATIANTVDAVLVRKPDAVLTAFVTAVSEFPKRPERTRLPPEINGELGSRAARARWDILMSSAALGARSNIVRKALASPDLEAMQPRTAAIDDFRPCNIECSDAPREAAIPSTRCASSIASNDVNNESSIPYFPLTVTPVCD
jgi:hypothetical protein